MKYGLILFTLSVLSFTSEAAQIKAVQNYDDVTINASIKEPNSLMLENDRIQQIKAPGNTLTDACNGEKTCQLIDEKTGILTFLPTTLYQTRPFTITVVTEKGYYYNVRVEPKPMPSQMIVFKSYKQPIIEARKPKTSGYEKVLLGFLSSLANGYLPEGFKQELAGKGAIYKANNSLLKRLLTVKGNNLTGEIFELKNLSKKPLHVKESNFNWPGTKALSLAKTTLAPNETIRLYRIS